jgi:Spy/CpxP family protein refolding chaperone
MKENQVKSKWTIGLLIIYVLVISAGAQQNDSAQPLEGAIISVPQQRSGEPTSPPTRLQPLGGGAPDAQSYPEQLESVLAAMSAELGEIAQAVREGKITHSQGEYLSLERYYVALARFQFLRTLYQNPVAGDQPQSFSQANPPLQMSGNTGLISSLTCSPDLPQQLVAYLQLSPAQIGAIQGQVMDECKQVQPLLDRLEKSRQKLISLKLSGKSDANEVQTLAAEQSRIIQQLIVENSQLETKLYGMLTSEQQRKVDGLLRATLNSAVNAPPAEF